MRRQVRERGKGMKGERERVVEERLEGREGGK